MTESLDHWLERALNVVEVGASEPFANQEVVTLVLDLAKDAAHNIARPAAPIATFALGFVAASCSSIEELKLVAERISAAASSNVERAVELGNEASCR